MQEIHCRSCGMSQRFARVSDAPSRGCPSCGAGLWRRRHASPTPLTHFGAVLRGALSLPMILFAVLYAALALVPVFPLPFLAAGLLYAVAIQFATRAMVVEHGRAVEPPEVTGEELWSFGWALRSALHAIVYVLLPALVLGVGLFGPSPFGKPAMVFAALLAGYGPMALALMIGEHSVAGLFRYPTGLKLLARDPLGYLGLAGAFGLVYTGDMALGGALSTLWLGALHGVVHAVAVLVLFGLVGLYIRKHARFFAVPVDEADWEPLAVHGAPRATVGPRGIQVIRASRRPQRAPIEVEGWDETPAWDEALVVDVVSGPAPASRPAPVQWPPLAAGGARGWETDLTTQPAFAAPASWPPPPPTNP